MDLSLLDQQPQNTEGSPRSLHKIWIPTTGCTPQDSAELHPAVRIARAGGKGERFSYQRKGDFIPCMWQNTDVNTDLHVCSNLTSALKCAFTGNFRKLKDSPLKTPLSTAVPLTASLAAAPVSGHGRVFQDLHLVLHGHCQCHQPSTHP